MLFDQVNFIFCVPINLFLALKIKIVGNIRFKTIYGFCAIFAVESNWTASISVIMTKQISFIR